MSELLRNLIGSLHVSLVWLESIESQARVCRETIQGQIDAARMTLTQEQEQKKEQEGEDERLRDFAHTPYVVTPDLMNRLQPQHPIPLTEESMELLARLQREQEEARETERVADESQDNSPSISLEVASEILPSFEEAAVELSRLDKEILANPTDTEEQRTDWRAN